MVGVDVGAAVGALGAVVDVGETAVVVVVWGGGSGSGSVAWGAGGADGDRALVVV